MSGPTSGYRTISAQLWLWFDIYGIKSWQRFADNENRVLADPIAGILTTLSGDVFYSHTVLATRPASLFRRLLFQLCRGLQGRSDPESRKPPGHLFAVSVRLRVAASPRRRKLARRKLRQLLAAFGGFENPPFTHFLPHILLATHFSALHAGTGHNLASGDRECSHGKDGNRTLLAAGAACGHPHKRKESSCSERSISTIAMTCSVSVRKIVAGTWSSLEKPVWANRRSSRT